VRVQLVDCRWELGDPEAGRRLYAAGHIPGASFLDVDADLSDLSLAGAGRHPLPSAERFAAAASAAGIGPGVLVVAYGTMGGAERLWWLLRHFGHDKAAVLDGGLRGWYAAGGTVDDLPARPWPSGEPFKPRARRDDTVGAKELAKRLSDEKLALVDARAPARFRGEVEPIDPVAGHIPGAANVPYSSVAPSGRFLAPAELRDRLDPGPGRELVAYCGSGITASQLVLAAQVAGLEARLFPGSWSEWCARGLPVAVGE
jgi:thiosulfate/3-mercaptopyruvate sulfurtransferase